MKPRLYSRLAIGLCTLFLTTILGCVLFAANLNQTDRGKYSYYFFIGGICWYSITITLVDRLLPNTSFLPLLVTNVLGSIILSYPLWNRFFGQYQEYEVRSVEKPVVLFVGFCTVIGLLIWFWGNNWAAG